MTEFSNRIDAQRSVLKIVNDSVKTNEQLFSLSSKAIQRWGNINKINPNSELISLIIKISDKLFFLANKSQEQISTEYKNISKEISVITQEIRISLQDYVITNNKPNEQG